MRAFLTVFALSAILIASVGVTQTFAQITEPIVVKTDKSSYDDGDTIIITGEVKDLIGQPVALLVIEPQFGNIVAIEQIDVGSDKTFRTELTAGGSYWKAEGTYTVEVTYGSEARTAQTTFEFGGSTGIVKPSEKSIMVEGTNLSIGYQITGGQVLRIFPDAEAGSLIIQISTTSDGQITLNLLREVIDSKLNGCEGEDDDFFVLVDGEEVDFDETKGTTERTLTIMFFEGAEEIEIIGTCVIPEFGTIAALILAVAIISIIAVTAKTRLRVMPKY